MEEQVSMNLNPAGGADSQDGSSGWDQLVAIKNRNMHLIETYDQEFFRYFGRRLHWYHSLLFGFDSIAFDDQIIKSGENESCAEVVERDYGPDALALIKRLLRMDEDST